jgi:hypothetical protein
LFSIFTMNEKFFDKDTGLIALLAAGWAAVKLVDVNLFLQVLCGFGAFIVMLPKIIAVFRKAIIAAKRRKKRKVNAGQN